MEGEHVLKLMVAATLVLTVLCFTLWWRIAQRPGVKARVLSPLVQRLCDDGNYLRCVQLLKTTATSSVGELALYLLGLSLSRGAMPDRSEGSEPYRATPTPPEGFERTRDRAIAERVEELRRRVLWMGLPPLFCGAIAAALAATVMIVQQSEAHPGLLVLGLCNTALVVFVAHTVDQELEGLGYFAEQHRGLVLPLEEFDEPRREAAERAREILRKLDRW